MNIRPHIADRTTLPAPKMRRVRARACEPRGLRREDAAFYIGISPTLFDRWVKDGHMPEAKKLGETVIWDRLALDEAFDALPAREIGVKENPFRDIAL